MFYNLKDVLNSEWEEEERGSSFQTSSCIPYMHGQLFLVTSLH